MNPAPAPIGDVGYSELTQALLDGTRDPSAFRHADHVAVAFDVLTRHSFVDAAAMYLRAIDALATAAGAPEKVNTTVTLAFLSLIAERMALAPDASFETFRASNADLMRRDALSAWYSSSRLSSGAARRTFLLPDRVPPAG